jgi:hypothetical protein
MSSRRFYQWSLLLPLVMPIVLLAAISLLRAFGPSVDPVNTLAGWLAGALLLGGIPYVLFVCLIYFHLRERSLRYHIIATFWIPIAFSVLLASVAFTFGLRHDSHEAREASLLFGLLGLGFGYFYVLLAHVLHVVARRMGKVVASHHTPSSTGN